MISKSELIQMSLQDSDALESGVLVDIGHVSLDSSLTATQQMDSYLSKTNNLYCFLCGDVPVKIEFSTHAKPLAEKLSDYFIGQKNR